MKQEATSAIAVLLERNFLESPTDRLWQADRRVDDIGADEISSSGQAAVSG